MLTATALTAALTAATAAGPARAEALRVVASIKPVHALTAAVMDGVGTPALLTSGTVSPHGMNLKPSQARMLARAGLVVWVGPALELALTRPVRNLAGKAVALALQDAPGVRTLKLREGGIWEAHGDHGGHDGHGHGDGHESDGHESDGHGKHEHDRHDDDKHEHDKHGDGHGDGHGKQEADGHEKHGHDEHAHDKHGDEHADDKHADGDRADRADRADIDGHIWLDPQNAIAMTRAIAAALVRADAPNAAAYRANANAAIRRLEALDAEIARTLRPVRGKRYIVFHDAYQYFEQRYRLTPAGSITLDPQRAPSPRRVYDIRTRILERGASCVFREPQFEPKIVTVLVRGTDARVGTLDPLGAALPAGKQAYATLLRGLAAGLRACLAG